VNKNKKLTSLLIVGLLLLSPVHADTNPTQRIISLAPSITEMLFVLGQGERVVGVTRYCDYPEAASQLPQVGGYRSQL